MPSRKSRSQPLYVEFDGTLVSSAVLWESVLRFIRRRPLMIVRVLIWVIRGREFLQRQIAARDSIDGAVLPYRPEVLAHLEQQHRAGRRLILVGGADPRRVSAAASHLNLFHHILDPVDADLDRDATKLEIIQADAKGKPFDYLADGRADPEVLRGARSVTIAGPWPRPGGEETADVGVARVLVQPGRLAGVLQSLRVHQWSKNLLVAVPAVMAQVVGQGAVIGRLALAFVAFSLTASGLYVLNDLFDLDTDRRSFSKRRRPFASGHLPVTWGLVMAPLLVLVGAGLSFATLGVPFGLTILVYVGLTAAYSIDLKHRMLVDVIVLAGLYTLRLLAGGAAIDVQVSSWLLAFSMFFFLSLAFAKRFNELATSGDAEHGLRLARPYEAVDAGAFQVVGPTCGLLSILVLALYINSDTVMNLYQGEPRLLWFLCPVLLYWIVRVWFLTLRGRLHEDPVVFALKDRASYVVAAMALILLFLAAR
jgi:4-hydroxybenzoate polyprenyltransferase